MQKKFLVITMGAVMSSLAVTACGKRESSDHPPRQEVAPTPGSSLPEGTVIAVPVSQDGSEQVDQAEMRLLPQIPGNVSAESITGIFARGQHPERFVDDLDQSSSTEAFTGWQNYQQRGYGYGHHRPNRGCRDYRYYQPTYYNRGSIFSWLFQNRYQTPGMNYYYYQRPSIWPQYQGNQYPYGQPYGSDDSYAGYDDRYGYGASPVTPYHR